MPPVTMATLAKELGDVKGTLQVHLAECAILRRESIDAQKETRDALKFAGKAFVGVIMALLGWFAVQAYNGVLAAQSAPAAQHQGR